VAANSTGLRLGKRVCNHQNLNCQPISEEANIMNSNTKTAQTFALSKGLTPASVAEFNMGDDEGL
jgi:hypothetical protein